MNFQKTQNILPSSNLLKFLDHLKKFIKYTLVWDRGQPPRMHSHPSEVYQPLVVIDDLFHVKSLRSKLKLCSLSQLVTGYVSIICIRRLVSRKISWVIPRRSFTLDKVTVYRCNLFKTFKKRYKNVKYSLIILEFHVKWRPNFQIFI